MSGLAERRLVLFGELHGTSEAPAFVGELLAATPGALLGIEWPDALQLAVDAFLETGHLAKLIATPHPFLQSHDGRATLAMLDLLERARTARARVMCFDGDFTSNEAREAGMAARLARAIGKRPTFVLCGNLHARTTRPWMGSFLRARFPDLLSLDLHHDGGTAWCATDEGTGPQTFPPMPPLERGIQLHAERDEDGFDGVYAVGPISASSPIA